MKTYLELAAELLALSIGIGTIILILTCLTAPDSLIAELGLVLEGWK